MSSVAPGPRAAAGVRDDVEHDGLRGHVAEGRIAALRLVVQRRQGVRDARGLCVRLEGRLAAARHEQFVLLPRLRQPRRAGDTEDPDRGGDEQVLGAEHCGGGYRGVAYRASRAEDGYEIYGVVQRVGYIPSVACCMLLHV